MAWLARLTLSNKANKLIIKFKQKKREPKIKQDDQTHQSTTIYIKFSCSVYLFPALLIQTMSLTHSTI